MENATRRLTFEIIDNRIKALQLDAESGVDEVLLSPDAMKRFVTIYGAVRPILMIVATSPLFPRHWRSALRLFLGTLDNVASFKAGKDL
jgi:hypothetical protein